MMSIRDWNHVSTMPPLGGIGSEFFLPTSILFKKNQNQFDKYVSGDSRLFLSSGRDALYCIIETLKLAKKDEVLLPSYLCKEVHSAFKDKVNVLFYKLNYDLSIDINDLSSKISECTKLIVVIHYFGFPQDISFIKELQNVNSFAILEDVVQSFLTESDGSILGQQADICISSYRKWLPVPDGMLLAFNKGVQVQSCTSFFSITHCIYVLIRFLGLSTKYFYLRHPTIVPQKISFCLFNYSEHLLAKYKKPAKMSKISRNLLDKFDYAMIISQRRKNFEILLNGLKDEVEIKPIFKKLPLGVCPLGFPIIVENRNELKNKLIENMIYPPIHWELPDAINRRHFPLSWYISEHILTIPIDQRYTEKEMEYILKILIKYRGSYGI